MEASTFYGKRRFEEPPSDNELERSDSSGDEFITEEERRRRIFGRNK